MVRPDGKLRDVGKEVDTWGEETNQQLIWNLQPRAPWILPNMERILGTKQVENGVLEF